MNKSYRLIVFDWEGTLGDTFGKILNALEDEAKQMALGDINEALARKYLALGLVVAIKKLFPDVSSEKKERLMQNIQTSSAAKTMNVYLLPGAKAIIQSLKAAGMDLAVATNKGQTSLQRDLHASGLEDFFTVTRSAGQVPPKPSPQMLEEIMDYCGVKPFETLMIGDSPSDMEMAASLAVDAIGVNFYNQPELPDDLLSSGALAVFDDYQKIIQFLEL